MEIKDLPDGMEQLSLFPEESTCSSEEPRARDSASRESKADCVMTEASSASPLYDLLKQCVPAGSSGKMFRASLAPGGARTSKRSCAPLMRSGIVAHGECWTLNTSEWTATLAPFLNADGVCSLADILQETGVIPRRYFLSRTACLGILRRAESRGKDLPTVLQAALERQIEYWENHPDLESSQCRKWNHRREQSGTFLAERKRACDEPC